MNKQQPTPQGQPMSEAELWAYLARVLSKYKGKCSNQQVVTSSN